MDDPRLNFPPEPDFFTGSRRGDRILGIGLGIAWWIGGTILMMVTHGSIFPVLLLAYIVQLVFLGRRGDARTLLLTLVLTTVLLPVVIFLGLFGMCALGGLNLKL